MKIINEIKLDFDNVLIKPKRSTLSSRSEVDLLREFTFPHSKRKLNCVPIVSANMDTTGSMEMARTLSGFDCITCLHKHYSATDLLNYFSDPQDYTFYSTGISESDIEKLTTVYDKLTYKPNLCIDVANGYSEKFVQTIKKIRDWYPDIIIMAGNVVTPEMTEELILHGGVDIVKVGIGSGSVCTTRLKTGCFISGTLVKTKTGHKNIEDIKNGEMVLTHDGSYQKVLEVHNNGERDDLLEINGTVCTLDHKFYVVDRKQENQITDENIHNFAYWLEASKISEEEHYIIEITE